MPFAHRKGDLTQGHPFPPPQQYPPMPSIEGSPDTFVNGLAQVRKGDKYANHGHNPSPPLPTANAGSATHFTNGKASVRKGDAVSCGDKAWGCSPDKSIGG